MFRSFFPSCPFPCPSHIRHCPPLRPSLCPSRCPSLSHYLSLSFKVLHNGKPVPPVLPGSLALWVLMMMLTSVVVRVPRSPRTRVGRRRPRFVRGKTSSAPSEKMSDVDRRKRRPAVEILSSFFFPSFLPFASFSLDLSLTPSSEGPKFVALHVVVRVSSNRDDADEPDVVEEGERETARENLVQTAARCRRRARGSSSLR